MARTADPRDSRAHYLYAVLSREAGGSQSRRANDCSLHKAIAIDPKTHGRTLCSDSLTWRRVRRTPHRLQTALKIEPENAQLYQLRVAPRQDVKQAEAERRLEPFQRVKAKNPDEEKSLVQILRVVPEKPP